MRVPNKQPNPFVQQPKALKSSEKLGAGPKDIELKTFKTHSASQKSPGAETSGKPAGRSPSPETKELQRRLDNLRNADHPTFKDAETQTASASIRPKEMKDQGTQTSKPLPPIPQRPARSEARPTSEAHANSNDRPAHDPSILAPTPRRPNIPNRVESLEAGIVRQSARTGEPGPAGLPQSPHPPRHQLLRHVHGLMKQEQNHMASHPIGSEAHNLHKQNAQYLKRYEQILEKQGSSVLASEQRQIDQHSRAQKTDLANLQAAIKPVEKDMGKVQKMLSKLEGEKAAIEKQLAVSGAQSKGDKAPVKFSEKITHKGRTKHLADFELGNSGKGFMGMFKRSDRLDKLSKGELQARLSSVKEDIGKASGWMQEYETEKAGLAGRPRYTPPTYDAVSLPSRERILKMMHESQPLRKTPWKDPLTDLGPKVEASKQEPPLKSALRSPVYNPDRPAKQVSFASDIHGNPKISGPFDGRPIPEGAIGVPENPMPPTPRPLPTPPQGNPAASRPSRPLHVAQGESLQRPGNPLAGSFDRQDDAVQYQMMRDRLSQRSTESRTPEVSPRPTQISSARGAEITRLTQAGVRINIPPGGLSFMGPDGPELIL